MPEVYDVSVRFMRRVQMKEYEPAECEIALKAQIKEGEDATSVAANLAAQARATVIATLKGEAPPSPAAFQAPVAAVEAAPATEPPAETEAAPAAPAKRKRRTKAEMEAARAAEAGEIPDDQDIAEMKAEAAVDDIPDAPAAAQPSEKIKRADISALMSRYVGSKQLTVKAIKDIILDVGGAARVADVPEDNLQALSAAIEVAALG